MSHVLETHYAMSTADQARIPDLEGVVVSCVDKVRDMYSEHTTLTAEAESEADALRKRIARGEQQVAHVFNKYEHLSREDQREYFMLEQSYQTCQTENAHMF